MSMDNACEPQKELQIVREKNQAFNELDRLSAKMSNLVGRLEPALRNPEPPMEKKSMEKKSTESTAEHALVPLASDFREISFHIRNRICQIDDTLERLEL